MLKNGRLFLPVLLLVAVPVVRAVYAPIPTQEQGKALTVYLGGGAYYDTNIFGAASGEIDSLVCQFLPSLAFNASVGKQTFASAAYRASLDYIANRPGKKLLDSHELAARLAHTFNPESEIDLSDSYQISKNPESLLPGVGTISGDQSYRRNQLDARFSLGLTRRTGLLFKMRQSTMAYEESRLGDELDRSEWTAGVTAGHSLLPTLKASAEYRYQRIDYWTSGWFKDKQSHFLLAGTDWALNSRVAASVRIGAEYRMRRSAHDIATPYAEIGVKRDYAKDSFVSVGYSYSLEETSGVQRFTDVAVNRLFVNWQHVLTPKLVGSALVDWDPSILQGRPGVSPNRNETNTRIGLTLTYRVLANWSLSSSLDIDRIRSDEPGRGLSRERVGVSARYAF
ncbi:hypothetical protein DB347_14920 [Opitutaceae bacterium EW11]|nr:hypothetical protein DB347_14920 [Opitutaceae bacterium EW11]